MKLLKKKIKEPTSDTNLDLDVVIPTNPEIPPSIVPYPEHLISSPEVVGYPTLEFQENIYRLSVQGVFDPAIKSVLDIGCGRGDFGSYLKKVVNPELDYTGIDMNPLHVDIGKYKFKDFLNFNLISGNILEYSGTHDICVINSIFENNYDNHTTDKYEYFKEILIKALDISDLGVVIIALNDRYPNEPYITHNMSEIVKILTELELKFSLENTELPNVYKVMIHKQSF